MIKPHTIYTNAHTPRSPIDESGDAPRTTVRLPQTTANFGGWGPRLG
jgi:hypothetical protein